MIGEEENMEDFFSFIDIFCKLDLSFVLMLSLCACHFERFIQFCFCFAHSFNYFLAKHIFCIFSYVLNKESFKKNLQYYEKYIHPQIMPTYFNVYIFAVL